MGRSIFFGLLLALAVSTALPVAADAAQIQAGLQSQLQALRDDDFISVILIMRDQADIAGLNTELKTQHARMPERHARVLDALQNAAAASQPPVLATLESERARGRVAGFTRHWISNLIVAKVTKACLYQLAARDDIATIEPNFTVELIEPLRSDGDGTPAAPQRGIGVTPGLRAINADRVWYELGINGTGTIVANCDTGVDGTHPALASRWRGLYAPPSECWLNLIGGHPSFPYDGGAHGTHVMGTITGLGAATEDTVGVAWGALWIAADPINQGVSSEFDNDIIVAYEWFTDPDGNPNSNNDVPDVIQNSWRINEGFGSDYTDCDSRWWAVIDNCEAAGCVTTWSAGNEGYGTPQTIGSPADRATTLMNCFSVGAVDATNYDYPWPIADFSSLGPTGCAVPADRKIKPEIVAPGVDVYSSIPGGGYTASYSGTSMAGPHVAGVVALMREANPDLDVDTVKEIIMATAVDLGPAGEENTFGWGMIDAYAAVTAAMTGFGRIEGVVTNVSNGGTPAVGVTIEIMETGRTTLTEAGGHYAMSLAADTYTVRASNPSFAPLTYTGVVVAADQTTVRNFSLTDIGAPAITNTTDYGSTTNTAGPYLIQTTVIDQFSAVAYARLSYRVNGGVFRMLNMNPLPNHAYLAGIMGQPYTSLVEYYISGADVAGNVASDPPTAPAELYSFNVAPGIVALDDNIESGAPGWTHGSVTTGYGDQWHVSTQRNHTPAGSQSWKCGATGGGNYANLLDAGLVTPLLPLSNQLTLRFYHWIDAAVSTQYPEYAFDGGIVEISMEGGPWQPLVPEGGYDHLIARQTTPPGPFADNTPCFSGTHGWELVEIDLSAYAGNGRVRFRFGSDATGGMEGWYIDDVLVNGFLTDLSAVPEGVARETPRLYPADPNPFNGETRLRYELGMAADVRLALFDPAGRLVRTLVTGPQQPGLYQSIWDGRDDRALPVPPGVYFYRLQTDRQTAAGKVIMTR